MKNDWEWKELGQFVLSYPRLAVSDPCQHTADVILQNCLNGYWNAYILMDDRSFMGACVAALAVCAEGQDEVLRESVERDKEDWLHESDLEIGVDSGQAGFFDAAFYRRDDVIDPASFTQDFRGWPADYGPWYRACCNVTLSDAQAGIIPHGVASSSGNGDGCYPLFTHVNQSGWTDMAVMRFINEEDE